MPSSPVRVNVSPVLTLLSINSLTLVDRLYLEFDKGMSVITGETGAGKSILLGALKLALGDRADSSLIAAGASKTEINAVFDLTQQSDALAWLETRDLENGDECILRRVVSREGRSRAFINGKSTTLGELKTLTEMLLDVHSQHEHQSLLRRETHRKLLDEFGNLGDLINQVQEEFRKMQQLSDALAKCLQDSEEASARAQLLSYQAEELSNLAVSEGETSRLEAEQKTLNSADEVQSRLMEVRHVCEGSDDQGASHLISRALSLLETIDDDAIKAIREMLASAAIQIDEAVADLNNCADRFVANPERQQQVEARLSSIYEAARKHKIQPDELPALTVKIQEELDDLLNVEDRIEALQTDKAAAESAYQELAEEISRARAKTARKLESEVTLSLQELGMKGARFKVDVSSGTASAHGSDNIEFQVATLPGREPGALSRIASGGELSRISLAIQVITATSSNTPTLVFDEVDVGVGGATAEVVGRLLRKLGARAQIVCVTHLPQVAAQGHHHYVVTRATTSDSASTSVTRLSEEEKVDEIARMLGGIEKTEESVEHARAMISGNSQNVQATAQETKATARKDKATARKA